MQGSLLDAMRSGSSAHDAYRPPALPDLSWETDLVFDWETTGLRWHKDDRPCGLGVGTLDGRSWYLPIRQAGGSNIPVERFREWARSDEGLRGKRLAGFKTSFDAHMSRVEGLDLEELGCDVTDVAHHAALLDDSRRELNLNSVARTYLGPAAQKIDLDMSRGGHIYHANEIAPYAVRDIELTRDSMLAMRPMIEEQGLQEVLRIEDDCILPTVEMERNAAYVDMEKLKLWLRDSANDLKWALVELQEAVGFAVEPTSSKDLRRMFGHLSLTIPRVQYGDKAYVKGVPDEDQAETFGDPYLRKIKHPAVRVLRRAKKLASLRSKYLIPYWDEASRNGGFVRYALNQLRSDDGGTISGRYSSSAFTTNPREGVNIQQVAGKKVMSALKEVDPVLLKYNIRELFIPAPGFLWFRADAKQIEYRIFAHLAKPPAIIAAYLANPDVDYHNIVMEMIRKVLASITRERTKDLNFAMLFGAGVKKIAYMMGVTEAEARQFVAAYMEAFPEAKALGATAQRVLETRGYVTTIAGRRARFTGREMLNSALNRVIQGSAADINKKKVAEVAAVRRELGLIMRLTVHDELGLDVPRECAEEARERLKTILDRQSFKTNVPILWDTKVGENWAKAA